MVVQSYMFTKLVKEIWPNTQPLLFLSRNYTHYSTQVQIDVVYIAIEPISG
jgi:hypothetical protein